MAQRRRGQRHRLATATLVASVAACTLMVSCGSGAEPSNQKTSPELLRLQTPPKKATVDPNAPPHVQELQRKLVATEDHELDVAAWEGARADRAELVRAAPAGFKPKTKGKKLNLRLILARAKIRAGERLWYRLELQNIGSEPVTVTDPIFKHVIPPGLDSHVDFIVTLPNGKEEKAIPPFFGDPDKPPVTDVFETRIPIAELPARRKRQIEHSMKIRVQALILPGETLVSRPEKDSRRDVPPAAEGAFRPLISDFSFKAPGHYKVRAVFGDPKPLPPSAELLTDVAAHGGDRKAELMAYDLELKHWSPPIESNSVTLEVTH